MRSKLAELWCWLLGGHEWMPRIVGGDLYLPQECKWCGKLAPGEMENVL